MKCDYFKSNQYFHIILGVAILVVKQLNNNLLLDFVNPLNELLWM